VLVVLFQTFVSNFALISNNASQNDCPETQVGIIYYKMLMIELLVEVIGECPLPLFAFACVL
jgi:hypothetical protein